MEYLFADDAETVFLGDRGKDFTKLIQITTKNQISIVAKVPADLKCELTIQDRPVESHAPFWRTLRIMWQNFAPPNPETPTVPTFDVNGNLGEVVIDEVPDILVISSTGSVFSAGNIDPLMRSVGHTVAIQKTVGIDGGVFCVSVNALGSIIQDESEGDNLETGIVLDYSWF